MFSELIEKLFGVLNSNSSNYISSPKGRSIKNASAPIELKSKNVVYPDNREEKEIKALYAEIRELQAKNREKINKNRFVCL